jgi:hypothetical protein
MDKWGRKGGVIYCSTLSIVGGVLLCASQNIGMFITFRFFAGAGSWGFLALSTSWPSNPFIFYNIGFYSNIPSSSTGIRSGTCSSRYARFLRRHERCYDRSRLRHSIIHGPGFLLLHRPQRTMARTSRSRSNLACNDAHRHLLRP